MAPTMTKVGLDLRITGTCLIVPNRRKKHIAVLMPQTGDMRHTPTVTGDHTCSHESGVQPHHSVLAIPEQHVDPSECEKVVQGWCIINLSQWHLRLHNGTEPMYSIGNVYRLDNASNRRAKGTFGSELRARVDLASGQPGKDAAGKLFRIDGGRVPMPNYMAWTIDDCFPRLTLTCLSCGTRRCIPLIPDGKSSIEILVQNVPKDEVGPWEGPYVPPPPGTTMDHFLALGQLLEPGHDPLEPPIWEGERANHVGIAAGHGGNPYTCMPGGTGPGEDGP